MEEEFEERVANLLRSQVQPICAPCAGALLGIPHLTARTALEGLAMADALAYRRQCHRCGGGDTVVGLRAA
jgi:hypothetical protein